MQIGLNSNLIIFSTGSLNFNMKTGLETWECLLSNKHRLNVQIVNYMEF